MVKVRFFNSSTVIFYDFLKINQNKKAEGNSEIINFKKAEGSSKVINLKRPKAEWSLGN